ncbi:dihydrofolate reductase family protein [Nocardioides sp. GY 10127]|uniref:dihydrofolate reductase family protein n=1 Tax=Nocardioides sp. GY 10127 TaxID=2569762 RepID=UPI0010A77F86|nr:dihydrofolate reductase family protein [Nocardioides sp. GY 10127]TIC80171.1 deaminase [Nocardioides sp. GY 10127]
MRTLVVTEMLTLDGIVDSPGNGDHPHAGWTFKDVAFDPAAYAIKGREQLEAGAMLLGRVSYTEFAPVWPSMTEEFPQYNAMPKYVVSTTLAEDELVDGWGETHLLRSLDEVAALKEETDGGPLIVHGSATLAQGLAAAGLVDRYHLLTFPLLLGSGKRLFADSPKTGLKVVEHEAYANGVTMQVLDVVR